MLQKYKQYVITLLFILLALPIVQAQGKKNRGFVARVRQ